MRDEQLLMALAQNHRGDLNALLRSFFKFLYDFTDLYVVDENPSRMGFKPGQAEARVLDAFRAFPYKAIEPTPRRREDDERRREPTPHLHRVHSKKSSNSSLDNEGKGPRRERSSSVEKDVKGGKTSSTTVENSKISSVEEGVEHKGPRKAESSSLEKDIASMTLTAGKGKSTDKPLESSAVETSISSSDSRLPSTKQRPVGNGGEGPGYVWTQTLKEVTVHIKVPKGTRGKDVDCTIESKKVHIRPKKTGSQAFLVGEYPGPELVNVSDSSWSLADDTILLMLTKKRETWWPSVVQGHPEIDTSKVDSSKRLDEYDADTEAAIRKLLAQQQQEQALYSSDAG